LVDNELNITTTTATQGQVDYIIVNTEGKLVKQNTVTGNSGYVYTMDVSDLSSGLYFITVNNASEHLTKKFIKK